MRTDILVVNPNMSFKSSVLPHRWLGQIFPPLHQERIWQVGTDSATQV